MACRFVLAEPTGLCFGVKLAIAGMERELKDGETLYCLGEPIHNPQEVARLSALGLKVISSPEEAPPGSRVFIRAHGVAPSLIDELKEQGKSVRDGSCPFVRMAQRRAMELEAEGRAVVLAGDEQHPEVKAILGCLKKRAIVVRDSTEAEELSIMPKIGLLSQTTLPEEHFADVARVLISKTADLRVCKTICAATVERQAAMRELARRCDGVVLIGGRNSANTGKLYKIGKEAGGDVQWIEEASEIDPHWLATKTTIGIAAGASTPNWLIEQFITAARRAADVKGDVRHE